MFKGTLPPSTSAGFRRAGGRAAREAGDAERSTAFEWLVRLGFTARGVTFGVIGVLTLALAFGAGTDGTTPDQQGALALVARAPLGFVALIVIAAGLLAYACWKLTQAIRGRGPEGGGGPSIAQRAASGGSAVVYLAFAGLAVHILAGSGAGNSNSGPRRAASGVLAWPGGTWIVGIVGVALLGLAAGQVYYGLTDRFLKQDKTEEMKPDELRVFSMVGRIGLSARGIVFGLCGYFLLQSAVTYNPRSAVGLDGALARLHHQAYGPWLVGLVGLGLLIFAGYSLYEARYRRL